MKVAIYARVLKDALVPYAGINIGAQYIQQRLDIGVVRFDDNNWHFVVAPELGMLVRLGYGTSALVSLRYNYAVESGGSINYSYLGLNVGLTFQAWDRIF